MSTVAPNRPAAPPSGLRPYRLNVRQFEAMIGAGLFEDGPRVELIHGRLIERMTKHEPHSFVVGSLCDLVRALVVPGGFVREEKPLEIGPDSRPEPDVSVVRGERGDYRQQIPPGTETALVIEVADSTYAKDHGRMLALYASAIIPVYWIVRLPERKVEVYSGPTGSGRSASYAECATFDDAAEVPVVIDGVERGRLAVRSFLP
ncbi:MAG: Uma2 family endonuclease [Isosphaeraceae bacterium]